MARRPRQTRKQSSGWQWRMPVLAATIATGGVYYAMQPSTPSLPGVNVIGRPAQSSGACNIKGNISDRGERIYHVPGQEYYSATRINPLRGERWFCSEDEARRAGWRRSRV